MSTNRIALALLLLAPAARAGEALPRIKAVDFPAVAQRAVFFEERINAPDAAARKRVLEEVGYFFDIPSPEYVSFLRRMLQDADPVVRGRALHKLHDLWVPVAVKHLPQKFAGYHDGQLIDLEDAGTIPALVKACRGGALEAGYAAYVLGLLRHKAAVPDLRKLADDGNIFVRHAAARALLDCGDREGARPILEAIADTQLAAYAGVGKANRDGRQPFYAAAACRALMELGPEDRKAGLEKLITLVGYLERSTEPNDQAHLPAVQQVLAAAAGQYFLSEAEARAWYRKQYAK
jgi:HEAT repeat protein